MLTLRSEPYSSASRKALYSFLGKLDIFIIPNFLSDKECSWLRCQMDEAEKKAPYHSIHKNLQHHCVSPEADSRVRGRFAEILPRIERHFGTSLAFEGAMEYSTYSRGGFLALHSDALRSEMCPYMGRRIAACTVYLSTEGPGRSSGCHQGGSLALHDLNFRKGTGERSNYSVTLPARAGLLIAFNVKLRHEVRPVLSGTRYSIVTRFIAAQDQ